MKKIGIIYGGKSTENEVSCLSAKSVMDNLDKDKFEIYPIYIDKKGVWYTGNEIIENEVEYLRKLDTVFPVLHGLNGEDGTIQGMLELLEIPYVGCKVLASAVGMDKVYSKIIFERAGLLQAKYIYIKCMKNKYYIVDKDFSELKVTEEQIKDKVEKELKFPIFVKPSNSGSSVGITKVESKNELQKAIENANMYDNKILIEEGISGRELECAVLGTDKVIASCTGEVKASSEFYSYDAKYNSKQSKTIIPSNIGKDIENEIQKCAIKAFKAIDGSGLSRVDFFVEHETNRIYINEINTLPGFTNISMYPKLFEASGIKYKELLSKLIEE